MHSSVLMDAGEVIFPSFLSVFLIILPISPSMGLCSKTVIKESGLEEVHIDLLRVTNN
jgi:hypothetical protein